MQHLKANKYLTHTIKGDGSHVIKWWVDASFFVHKFMKIHTGVTMSLGQGAAYTASIWKKLNTKRYPETKLV